ncbi:MAG: 6-phosphogluconolactonase [Bacteroidia bacterium]
MKIEIFDTPPAVAGAAALLLEQVAVAGSGPVHVALSGGSTPALLFDLLASTWRERLPWGRIHLWWGDERCVPPDHPDSNYGMTLDRLLRHVALPEVQVHRMRGEDTPEAEAQRYEAELLVHLPLHEGWPRFALVFLGMGDDGHTASLFPGQEVWQAHAAASCGVVSHPVSGQRRVTLTAPVLDHAAQTCFLVTGAGKAARIAEILGRSEGYLRYPAARVQPVEGQLHWLLDQAAASAWEKTQKAE